MRRREGYQPIEDYGAIGNLRSVALVGRDGSIDWCCFPHMDRGSVFGAILDRGKGGHFRVGPAGAASGSGAATESGVAVSGDQAYAGITNVLRTFLPGRSGGRLVVTDFMPLAGDLRKCGESKAFSEIHRLLEAEDAGQEVEIEWAPRFDYARARVAIARQGDGWLASGDEERLCLTHAGEGTIEDGPNGPVVRARLLLAPGERKALVTRWDSADTASSLEESDGRLRETMEAWEGWTRGDRPGSLCAEWAGEWQPMVLRSALVLKLLSHADTGAIAAAPTTSLPETIGGTRNWDYRFTWIRDAFLTAQALVGLGHKAEARDLMNWMERVSEQHREQGQQPQIMYGLHGEAELEEQILDHLEGYRGSRPVRVGNLAAGQFQLEVFGDLIDAGLELARTGGIRPEIRRLLTHVADHVCEVWRRPDHGIWEWRGEPQHMTYSKVMAWVALDRALTLADEHGLEGNTDRWRRVSAEIFEDVLAHGYSSAQRSFTFAYDSDELDAANLRIPLVGFLPPDDARVLGTIDRTMERLTDNGLVYRYLVDDHLPGKEGAFGLCTFWLADALALAGRVEEARRIFEGMASHANHLGLFSEQYDPGTGECLGNFPQAFTHIGLINSALFLTWAEGREIPEGTEPVNVTRTRRRSLTARR